MSLVPAIKQDFALSPRAEVYNCECPNCHARFNTSNSGIVIDDGTLICDGCPNCGTPVDILIPSFGDKVITLNNRDWQRWIMTAKATEV